MRKRINKQRGELVDLASSRKHISGFERKIEKEEEPSISGGV